MKNIKFLCLFVFVALFLTSCNSDDDNNNNEGNVSSNDLIGTWLLISETVNGEVDDLDGECPNYLVFTSELLIRTEYDGDNCEFSEDFSISYELVGDNIMVEVEDVALDVEILTLNAQVLELKVEETYIEEGEEFTEIITETYAKQ